jgi:hypothetical protein
MSALVKLGSALLLCRCAAGACAEPTQPALTVTAGAITNRFTAAELLARPDLVSVQIPPGVDYDVELTVQALPLLDLLAASPLGGFDRLEATATDGFVAQIPLALIKAGKSGGSVAWVAVKRSRVANEQWPYMLEKLTAVQSPEVRWPQLKVNETLSANARRG